MNTPPTTLNFVDFAGLPTVLLRHELPDQTSHIDWMLAPDSAGEAALIAFRLQRRLDEMRPRDRIAAERIADHRRAYLEYEGPVSDGRGSVSRLRRGEIIAHRNGDSSQQARWDLQITWSACGFKHVPSPNRHNQHVQLVNCDGCRWDVLCVTMK